MMAAKGADENILQSFNIPVIICKHWVIPFFCQHSSSMCHFVAYVFFRIGYVCSVPSTKGVLILIKPFGFYSNVIY